MTVMSRQHTKSLLVPQEMDLFCDVVLSPFRQVESGRWVADLSVTRRVDGRRFEAHLSLDPEFPRRDRREQKAFLQIGWDGLMANLKAQHEASPPGPVQ